VLLNKDFLERGLSSEEVAEAQKKYGPNKLPEAKRKRYCNNLSTNSRAS